MRLGLVRSLGMALVIALAINPMTADAAAKKKTASKKKPTAAAVAAYRAQVEARKSAILIDARTGEVLYADRADEPRHPASLTKMMTLYMAFDALKAGRLRLDQRLPVSYHAAAQEPTKLDLQPGSTISVEDAILAAAIKSANDAAVVLAEAIGNGSEETFARMMTNRARALGMNRTNFHNASGLPDPAQITTARDFATLAQALYRDHRQFYHYFGYTEFEFQGRVIPGHNRVTQYYDGADGLKTGFIRASGFNLASSAERGGRRLVGVVFGGETAASRDREMMAMLDRGFSGEVMMAARRQPQGPTLISAASAGELGRQFTVASANAQPAAEAVEAVADEAPVLRTKPAAKAAVKPQAQPVPAKAETAKAPTPHETAKAKALADKSKPKLVAQAKTPDVPHKPAAAPRAAKGGAVIQVGAFSQRSAAERQIDAAQAAVPKLLGDSDPAVVKDSGGKVYRARLAGLTPVQAKQACDTLKRHNIHCAIVAGGAS